MSEAPAFIRTAMDNKDIRLYCKNTDDKWATMSFSIQKNNFDISIWTNQSDDANSSRPIKASLDVVTLGIFLTSLKDVLSRGDIEYKAPILEVEKTKWVRDSNTGKNKPDGTVTDFKLHLGKDKEGLIWIAVTQYKRPNLKFVFHKPNSRKLLRADGSSLSESELSVISAKSYLKIFEQMAYTLLANNYVEPPAKQSNYNNNSNNNYNSNNNNSNRSNNVDNYQEDIPF